MHTPAQTDAMPPMLNLAGTTALLRLLEAAILGDVRNDGPDLTNRGLAILLVIHTVDGLHTIRGIAAHLGISRPAASRSMDRLEEFALAKREDDPRDARSVLLVRTSAGAEYVEAYARTAMASAAANALPQPSISEIDYLVVVPPDVVDPVGAPPVDVPEAPVVPGADSAVPTPLRMPPVEVVPDPLLLVVA